MAEQTKGNWKIWALVAVLVAAGGGYFAKMYMEKKMASDIEQTLANMPGGFVLKAENIGVDVFSKSAVLTKITGSGKIEGDTITVSVDSAEGRGLNLSAFKEKGVTSLADSLVLRNVKAAGPGVDFSAGLYQLEKVRGDFVAIAEQSIKLWGIIRAGQAASEAKDTAASKKAQADLLAAVRDGAFSDALGSLHMGKARVEKYAVTMKLASTKYPDAPKIALRMDYSEGTDYSVTHYGPMIGRGLVVEMNDKPLVSLEELSLKSMDMPAYKDLMKMGEAGSKPSFKAVKMSMQDLRVKKLNITLPMEGQETISLDDLNFGFSLDQGAGAVALKVDRLDLPTALLTRDNPMALMVQDLLPQRTLLNKDVDIVVTSKENDVADVSIKKLNASVKDLGAVALSGDVLDIDVAGGRTESLVRKLDLALTDGGFVKIGLAVRAMMDGSGDPDAVRASLIDQIEAQRAMLPNQTLKDVNIALTEFLKQPGGTVRLVVAPEKPVSVRGVRRLIMSDTAKLGISSSFTPGK